ncbi:phosphoribosyltransferase [Streptomyces lusitanus]|uniref:phosphoribosyltransferase n=1 Tax=Streptomyces lusitanus TaxID=68232 RepID=UPI0021BFFA99|nr:phosphoribosyltransferase [Streptomyces lusitanus]
MAFRLTAFESNGRADRLEKYQFLTRADIDTPEKWIDLCGSQAIARQFLSAYPTQCVEVEVPQEEAASWSHRLYFAQGLPAGVATFAQLMTKILTLVTHPPLDFALVLDWYKIPDPDIDPYYWHNTEAGELNRRSKYFNGSPGIQAAARDKLVDQLSHVISEHPLYRDAAYLVTVPGSAADGKSHAEQLAQKIAHSTGKRIIQTQSLKGPRPPAKEQQTLLSPDDFALPHSVTGDVVIVDDVYRSGGTMRAVAGAAKRSGATRALGLAIVRTMRN